MGLKRQNLSLIYLDYNYPPFWSVDLKVKSFTLHFTCEN